MQLQNSIASISSAGFKGHGFMANPIYYPEAHTDFVFVSIATSLGFIGSFIFVGLLLALDLRILEIGVNNKKPINRYITNSVCCILLFQQIQNIGMTIGLLPIMGITLPFVSYGGSSLISYMFMIGLVLNIYKESSSRMNL